MTFCGGRSTFSFVWADECINTDLVRLAKDRRLSWSQRDILFCLGFEDKIRVDVIDLPVVYEEADDVKPAVLHASTGLRKEQKLIGRGIRARLRT